MPATAMPNCAAKTTLAEWHAACGDVDLYGLLAFTGSISHAEMLDRGMRNQRCCKDQCCCKDRFTLENVSVVSNASDPAAEQLEELQDEPHRESAESTSDGRSASLGMLIGGTVAAAGTKIGPFIIVGPHRWSTERRLTDRRLTVA